MTSKRTRKARASADVLITGAAGFIGMRLTSRLRSLGLTVIGTDLRTDDDIVAMDITSRDQVETVFAKTRPKRVIHLAAIVDDRGAADLFDAVNVRGTQHVLEAALKGPLERFVHVSSIVALGFNPGLKANENSRLVTNTGSPYFDTKARSEALVRTARDEEGAPIAIVRPGDVYGPGSEPWVIRPLEMMRKRLPVLVDGGRGLIAHCWIDNLVDALVLATTHEDAAGHIFQVHDGSDTTTYKRYFTHLAQVAGAPKPRLALPYRPALILGRLFDVLAKRTPIEPPFSEAAVRFIARRSTYCMRTTREILNFNPAVNLEEGMTRLMHSLKA